MKTLKNIARNLFFATAIIGSAVTANAQASERIYHDAEAFDLKSHVKEVVLIGEYDNDTTRFDSNGAIMGYDEYQITRDKEGRLTSITLDTTYLDSTIVNGVLEVEPYNYRESHEFNWDKNRVSKYSYELLCDYYVSGGVGFTSTGNTFKYNRKGEITSMTSEYRVTEDKYFYSNYKYDNHGNWIERKVTTEYNEEKTSNIEIRIITYYE